MICKKIVINLQTYNNKINSNLNQMKDMICLKDQEIVKEEINQKIIKQDKQIRVKLKIYLIQMIMLGFQYQKLVKKTRVKFNKQAILKSHKNNKNSKNSSNILIQMMK